MLGLDGVTDDGLPRLQPQDQVDDADEGFNQRQNAQTGRAKCAGGDEQGDDCGDGNEQLTAEGPAEVTGQS